MQCNRKIGKKCLRLERHWLILLPLKIVLGGTTARRNIRCGGLYLFEVPEFCAWRTSSFPNLDLNLCLSVSPTALTRLPWLAVGVAPCARPACLDGIRDLTPAYCSLLLEFEHPEQVANQLGDLKEVIKSAKAWPAEEAPLHAIRVCYDGADIESLPAASGFRSPT
jgi:hypothetical protein